MHLPPKSRHLPRRTRRALAPQLEALEARLALSTFTVTNTKDSGPGSFRQAILDSNAHPQPTPNLINFAIPSTANPHLIAQSATIQPLSNLPDITARVIIDGRPAQPSAPAPSGGPLTFSNTTPGILLDGIDAGDHGIALYVSASAGGSTIEGLAVGRFSYDGIELISGGNVVQNCRIGTDITGTQALGNNGNGILVEGSGNTVVNNLISGNAFSGVQLGGLPDGGPAPANGTVIQGNHIGTNLAGTAALGNANGIKDLLGTGNVISGNVISGNRLNGIELAVGSQSDTVQRNLIGTDLTGTRPLGNQESGVWVLGAGHTIGGTASGQGNLISANEVGVAIDGAGFVAQYTLIQGNRVGTDFTGTKPLGNSLIGIDIVGCPNNTVQGNVVSASGLFGIAVHGRRSGNENISGNSIGTNAAGQLAKGMGNGTAGVAIYDLAGFSTVQNNVIMASAGAGVWIDSVGNTVLANTITKNQGGGIVTGHFNGQGVLRGQVFPNFTLLDQNGKPVSLSDFRGKYVFFDICFPGCAPCEQTALDIPQLQKLFAANNIPVQCLTILAAADGSGQTPATQADAQQWAKDFNLSIPILSGPEALALNNQLSLVSLSTDFPRYFIIGPDGTLVYSEDIGGMSLGYIYDFIATSAGKAQTVEDMFGFALPTFANRMNLNTIFDNGPGPGIDLNNDGVTPNSPDGRQVVGGTLVLNAPVLISANSDGTITGTFHGPFAGDTIEFDFYVNTTNKREGQTLLRSRVGVTDANGNIQFTIKLPSLSVLTAGSYITATATEATPIGPDMNTHGGTSEFSNPILITAAKVNTASR